MQTSTKKPNPLSGDALAVDSVEEATDQQEPASPVASKSVDTSWGARARRLLTRQAVSILVIVLIIVFSLTETAEFLTPANFTSVVLGQAVAAVLALAVLIPAVVGEFDVSVGYTLGFSAVVAAAAGGLAGWPGPVALALALGAGLAIGALNGALVAFLKINSLIATLGVGLAVSGLTVGVSGSTTLSQNIPSLFPTLARFPIFGVGSAVWIFLVVAAILYVVLAHTPTGRKMYAVGGSEKVARLIGIRTSLVKLIAFSVGGLIAALAGVLQLGLSGAASPTFGVNLLLPAFAAVFLGSTTIRPGQFNVGGTVVAILLLAIGFSGLSLAGVPFWTQNVFQGGALLVGVVLSQTGKRARR